ncbi:MAG: aminoacyl-tRNA hydrolase [Patescibacteria group bacterium]
MHHIVGLGNPGEEYAHTRHNTGVIVLEKIRKQWEFPEWKEDKKKKSLISTGTIDKTAVSLLFPQTRMNKSGAALSGVVLGEKQAGKLIVIHDDIDLPIGTLKASFNRGSGGHRGVESIMRAVKTEAFMRLRVGISPTTPGGKLKKPTGEKAVNNFILGKFSDKEQKALSSISRTASAILLTFFEKGKDSAIQEANQKGRS